jgi:hypothetical protein
VAGAFFGYLSEKPFQIRIFGQTSSPKVTKSHDVVTNELEKYLVDTLDRQL